MSFSLQPRPAFLRASAQDAANAQMRRAGRTSWNEDDYNLAVSTLDRLIRACYGRDADQDNARFMRFQQAEVQS